MTKLRLKLANDKSHNTDYAPTDKLLSVGCNFSHMMILYDRGNVVKKITFPPLAWFSLGQSEARSYNSKSDELIAIDLIGVKISYEVLCIIREAF